MTVPNFRPLSFGEILDGAFTLYRRNFRLFAGTSLLLMVGVFIAAVVLGGTGGAMMAIMPGFMGVLVALFVGVGIAALVTMVWSTLTWQAAQSYAGKPVSLGAALSAAGSAAMTLVGSGLVAFLTFVAMMIGVWMVAALLVGILGLVNLPWLTVLAGLVIALGGVAAMFFVAALFFGVLPAVMVEEKGPIEAISRSVELARGALPRIAGVLFVTMVIAWLPSIAIAAVTGGFEAAFNPDAAQTAAASSPVALLLEQVLALMVIVLTTPFLPCVFVLLYYDRRVRTEALDVQILTERLGLA